RDFGAGIEVSHVVTPADWAASGLAAGTPFASAHTVRQTGPFRPGNLYPGLDNVVFVGAGTQPGVGVPMVLISGRLAAARIAGGPLAKPTLSSWWTQTVGRAARRPSRPLTRCPAICTERFPSFLRTRPAGCCCSGAPRSRPGSPVVGRTRAAVTRRQASRSPRPQRYAFVKNSDSTSATR